jgi:hypothetical protein
MDSDWVTDKDGITYSRKAAEAQGIKIEEGGRQEYRRPAFPAGEFLMWGFGLAALFFGCYGLSTSVGSGGGEAVQETPEQRINSQIDRAQQMFQESEERHKYDRLMTDEELRQKYPR